jgi:polar amino acid transport system permease protein
MIEETIAVRTEPMRITKSERKPVRERLAVFPWWLLGIILIIGFMGYTIISRSNYAEAFNVIKVGFIVTLTISITAYAFALVIGLVASLGIISKNVVAYNISRLYIEVIRGVPMMVLIFFIALVLIPNMVNETIEIGEWFTGIGLSGIGAWLSNFNIQDISMQARAVIALSLTYGAFLAEIFRAGIQSIDRGQMEAARSLGMSYNQAMFKIILPQAIKNVLPALGNDFIAMVKDSSLVSLLAVRDITQVARLYAGRSFRFQEAYSTLAVLYLAITIGLSLLLRYVERRYSTDE